MLNLIVHLEESFSSGFSRHTNLRSDFRCFAHLWVIPLASRQELEMAAKKDEDMLDSMEGGSRNRADDNGSYSGVNVSLDNRQIV